MDRRILVLAFASFATGTEAYVYAGHLADLAADLNASVAAAGQLATVFAITYALSAPLIAGAAARFGRRKVMVTGLVLIGVLNLLAAAAPTLGALMAIRIVCGLAAGLVGPISTLAAAELAAPGQRGRAMAVVLSGLTLAFMLGIPVGSVVGDIAGWRGTFVYAGAIALVAALALRVVLPDMPGGQRVGLAAFRAALAKPVSANLALTLLGFAATFTTIAYIGPIVTAISGLTGSGIGAIQAMIGVGSIAGIIVGARSADGPGARRVLVLGFGISALALAAYSALMLAPIGPGILATALLAGATATGAATLFARTPVIQVRLVGASPEEARPVVLALNGSMVFLGQGLGAAMGGLVIAGPGLPWVGIAAAGLALIGMGLVVRLSLVAMPEAGSAPVPRGVRTGPEA